MYLLCFVFFFQAEDGIRDTSVTGVQTCALPILSWGIRLTLHNSNQHAVPHDIGVTGFWLAGDTTWPGLGTVACVQIGRASCRERVWVSVGAVCVKGKR